MEDPVTLATSLMTSYGLSVVGAIVILLVGLYAAGWASRLVGRLLARSERVDVTLQHFFSSLTKYAIIVFTVIAVLAEFGVETTSLIAVFGAAGLAIGLALQGTLSNVAAGVMLLLFRPFKVGDYIDGGGVAGTVKAIHLFTTELATPDNVQIIAPNGQLWGAAIHNYSYHPTRRVDILLGIAYEANIDQARKAVLEVAGQDARVHKDPEAMVAVVELADSSVNLTVRVWCDSADYWGLKFDLTHALKERMDAEGISIPYPQRTLHMVQESA